MSAVVVDLAHADQVMSLKETVHDSFGELGLLMNNAVTRIGGGIWESDDDWRRAMDANRPALSRWHPDYCEEFENYSGRHNKIE